MYIINAVTLNIYINIEIQKVITIYIKKPTSFAINISIYKKPNNDMFL